MKIVVFGSSGGVGRELVQQAVRVGHTVRAVHRSSASGVIPESAERYLLDDVSNALAVARAVEGCEAVLSAVGMRRANPKNPWSKVTSPVDLTESFARTLVQALSHQGPGRRVIVVSAAGVGDSRGALNGMLRWLFDHSNVGVAYRDLDRMESVLRDSALDWLAVRPVTLTNGPATGRAKVVDRFGLTSSIRRSDVAAWMLDQLRTTSPVIRTPMIAGA